MITEIFISGQISGNHTLRNAIITADSIERPAMFNGLYITFQTKKAACKALWNAYKKLRQDKYDAKASALSYCAKQSIRYDASSARIVDPNHHN